MKMPSLIKRKKLHAATARRPRSLGLPDGLGYEEMAEPNMKLSRALLIVLLLHIVAVAGIIAFNTIKTREAMTAPSAEVAAAPATEASPAAAPNANPSAATAVAPNEITQIAARTTASKAPEKAAAPVQPAAKNPSVEDSGKIYTVVKGDNPVTIARHLHVTYDALLELNQITDPRKLQIGQKLHIPAETIATKHKSAD